MWKKLINLKFWIPLFLIGIGAGLTFEMIKNKPKARKKPNFKKGKLVEVMEASLSNPIIENILFTDYLETKEQEMFIAKGSDYFFNNHEIIKILGRIKIKNLLYTPHVFLH